MARRASKGAAAGGGFFRIPSGVTRTIFAFFFICLGGLLFNLDRMGDTGLMLLKYKQFMPHFVARFLPGGSARTGSAQPSQQLSGRIIEVYDGDTATLLTTDNLKYKVRFFGIDAPEAAQDFGLVSRDALREKILGKEVTVKVAATDRYGRAVGQVMLDSRYINREMAAEGMAWYYKDFAANEYDLEEAERSARRERRGLWKNPAPQPPWEYRREHKK